MMYLIVFWVALITGVTIVGLVLLFHFKYKRTPSKTLCTFALCLFILCIIITEPGTHSLKLSGVEYTVEKPSPLQSMLPGKKDTKVKIKNVSNNPQLASFFIKSPSTIETISFESAGTAEASTLPISGGPGDTFATYKFKLNPGEIVQGSVVSQDSATIIPDVDNILIQPKTELIRQK